MGGADLDCFDYLNQVHAVALREEAPFVQEGEDRGPVGVLDDLARFALYGTVENRQGELLDIDDFGEELHDLFFRRLVDPTADPPEVADGGDIVPSGHHPLVGVGKEGLRRNSAPFEGLLHNRVGDIFRRPRGDGRFDQHKAVGLDLFAEDLETLFEGGDLGMALAAVTQGLLEVVALDVHHDHIGKAEDLICVRAGEGLLLPDAAGDQRGDLRVLRFHGGDAAV